MKGLRVDWLTFSYLLSGSFIYMAVTASYGPQIVIEFHSQSEFSGALFASLLLWFPMAWIAITVRRYNKLEESNDGH